MSPDDNAEILLLKHILFLGNVDVSEIPLRPEHFSVQRHVALWAKMQALHASGKTIDIITLEAPWVAELYLDPPCVANVKAWVENIKAAGAERIVKTAILDAVRDARGEADTVEKVQTALAKASLDDVGAIEPVKGVVMRTMDAIEAAYNRAGCVGVDCGLSVINANTSGIPRGVITIIGSRPSVGKTALSLSMALGAAKRGQRVDFYSLEDSEINVGRRLLAMESGVDGALILNAKMSQCEWAAVAKAAARLSELPIHIDTRIFRTASDLCRAARSNARVNKTDLIVVDYLQLLQQDARNNRHNDLDTVGIMLKELAKQINVGLIVNAQLNRDSEEGDRRPLNRHLRDSGSIEAHAHLILLLYRKDPEITECIISKNKDGPVCTAYLGWSPRTSTYTDATMDQIERYMRAEQNTRR